MERNLVLYPNQGRGKRFGRLTSYRTKSILEVGGKFLCFYFFDLVEPLSLDVIATTQNTERHKLFNYWFREWGKRYRGKADLEYVGLWPFRKPKTLFLTTLDMKRSMEGYDNLIVIPSDLLYMGNLEALIQHHEERDADLTFLSHPASYPENLSYAMDEDGRIISLWEGTPQNPHEFTIQIISRRLLDHRARLLFNMLLAFRRIKRGEVERRLFKKYRVYDFHDSRNYHRNINTPEDLKAARESLILSSI